MAELSPPCPRFAFFPYLAFFFFFLPPFIYLFIFLQARPARKRGEVKKYKIRYIFIYTIRYLFTNTAGTGGGARGGCAAAALTAGRGGKPRTWLACPHSAPRPHGGEIPSFGVSPDHPAANVSGESSPGGAGARHMPEGSRTCAARCLPPAVSLLSPGESLKPTASARPPLASGTGTELGMGSAQPSGPSR